MHTPSSQPQGSWVHFRGLIPFVISNTLNRSQLYKTEYPFNDFNVVSLIFCVSSFPYPRPHEPSPLWGMEVRRQSSRTEWNGIVSSFCCTRAFVTFFRVHPTGMWSFVVVFFTSQPAEQLHLPTSSWGWWWQTVSILAQIVWQQAPATKKACTQFEIMNHSTKKRNTFKASLIASWELPSKSTGEWRMESHWHN